MFLRNRGFTLVELMITLVIVAIGLSLALPTWTTFVEKRRITAAAEEIVSMMSYVQSEAIKRNEITTLSWNSTGGHSKNWCIGATLGTTACDCTETDTTASDYCAIDGTSYRLVQGNFTDINDEFLHTNGNLKSDSLSFDPIRGILTNVSAALATEIAANDYLYYMHSGKGSGGSRLFELQVRVNLVGRVSICNDDDRKSFDGVCAECP